MQKKNQPRKKKNNTKRDVLIKSLTKMLGDIDEEGLMFLTKQANVLLYNMRVKEINKNLDEAEKEKEGKGKKAQMDSYDVAIEEKNDGEHFYIIMNNSRVFFIREEMRSIVRICHASIDASDASQRLYRWFRENRKDLLIDGGIESSKNPSLANLYKNFSFTG